MSESLKPLDKKRGRPSNKNSIPVFVDGKGVPIVDHTSEPAHGTRFEIIDHLCLRCLGRLLRRRLPGRKPRYEIICSNCQETSLVEGDEPINCWCHKTAGMYGKIFECFKNSKPCTSLPNVILVREKPHVMKAPERMYRPAFSTSTDYL